MLCGPWSNSWDQHNILVIIKHYIIKHAFGIMVFLTPLYRDNETWDVLTAIAAIKDYAFPWNLIHTLVCALECGQLNNIQNFSMRVWSKIVELLLNYLNLKFWIVKGVQAFADLMISDPSNLLWQSSHLNSLLPPVRHPSLLPRRPLTKMGLFSATHKSALKHFDNAVILTQKSTHVAPVLVLQVLKVF